MLSADLTQLVMIPINAFLNYIAYDFSLFGIHLTIGTWFAMCLTFGIILKLLSALSGTDVLSRFFIKGVHGD